MEYLFKHSSTLKELRLDEFVVSEDSRSLDRWAGRTNFLSGVEINARAKEKAGDEEDMPLRRLWDNVDLQALWLAQRPNYLPRRPKHIRTCGGSTIDEWNTKESDEWESHLSLDDLSDDSLPW